MGKAERGKGHRAEREEAQIWRDLGFEKCVTARYESRSKDDQKVDLCFTEPFNIQVKFWKAAPSYHKILKEMPDDENMNIIVHKRAYQGKVVVMQAEDFYEILEMLINNKVIL